MAKRAVDRIRELEHQVAEYERKNVEQAIELGRQKKGVTTRDIVIKQLREEIAGQYEVGKILGAYMSIFLEDEGRVAIPKVKIAENLGKKITCTEDGDNYILEIGEQKKKYVCNFRQYVPVLVPICA